MMTFSVKMYCKDLECVRRMHTQLMGFDTAKAMHVYKSRAIDGYVEWICDAMPEFVTYLSIYLDDYRGMFKIDELHPASGEVLETIYLKKIL